MNVVIEQALAAANGQRHIFDPHFQTLQAPEPAAGERPQVSAATGALLREPAMTGGLETGRICCSRD